MRDLIPWCCAHYSARTGDALRPPHCLTVPRHAEHGLGLGSGLGIRVQSAQLMPQFRLSTAPSPPVLTPRHMTRSSRARNRVAQQRYRSRQRERLQEKEEMLAELNEQLAALTTEKARISGSRFGSQLRRRSGLDRTLTFMSGRAASQYK